MDLVREACWMEESEHWELYSEEERREFLFHIFKRVSTGGASNQYEDFAEPYFEATKALYKDLLTVQKNASGDVEVVSQVFEIHSLGDGGELFRRENPTNFFYVIVDPMSRHVNVWYFGYRPIW